MAKKGTLLTGIRVSGEVHLGNFLGAMQPALKRQSDYDSHLLVADYHGITTCPPSEEFKKNVLAISAAWLAAGLDTKHSILWKQSDVPEHLELAYILSCVTSIGLLERAHSYKDAKAKQKNIRAGLFYYPVLMAADILLYEADYVPVGKDQAQHLEMTRDMATFFNETYQPVLKLPHGLFDKEVETVPGTDGQKMSKSYNNGIELFAPESQLKKQVMGIKTDSKSLEEPKDAESCLVYQIYRLVAKKNEIQDMKSKLEAGNYGYGEAKKTLLSNILDSYGPMRKEFKRWMDSPGEIESELKKGASKAQEKAAKVMKKVKSAIGI